VYVSIVAYVALLLLVPLSAVLFATLRPPLATAAVFLSAWLFLPEGVAFDAPAVPPLDKHSIAALCALAGVLLTAWPRMRHARPGRGVDGFALLLLFGLLGTSATNRDPLSYMTTYLPGLSFYDAAAQAFRLSLTVVAPFLLGRALYRTTADLAHLMGMIVFAALLYLPLVAFELRLSPQLHRIVYGFHQHEFAQTLRGGGYRPMVFMHHGLALAMFLFTATLFGAALARARKPLALSLPPAPVAGLLGLFLVLCKSLGALVYAIAVLPVLIFGSARLQARVALLLAALVVAYPVLRMTDLFPTTALVDMAAARVNQDRASSLAFRFYNEDQLVAKALERKVFGWGSFGRNRIYNDWGTDISVTDGHWIIAFGAGGIVGLVGTFGLLLTPVLMARRRLPALPLAPDRLLIGALTLAVAVNTVDLLPNGLYSGFPLLLAGALAGVIGEQTHSEALATA
jgi:hypothetical protein